jgi:hypothetical protein
MVYGPSERTPKGVLDRIKRYGWSVKDKRGRYRAIHKSLLNIDPLYQRERNDPRVLTLAREWSWVSCCAINVSERPDGTFWVLDGQHRVLAAQRRDDIEDLDCMVFEIDDLAKEAGAFVQTNVNRRPLYVYEKLNAMALSGDPTAMAVQELIKRSKRIETKKSGPKNICCHGSMLRCANINLSALQAIWPLVLELCEGNVVHHWIVEAFHYLQVHIEGGVTSPRVRSRILSVGYDAIIQKISASSALYSKGGAKVWAQGVVAAVNYKAKSEYLQLPMKNMDEEN